MPETTSNITLQYQKDQLIPLLKAEAIRQGLDPSLMCAIAEQESGWGMYATRFEPAFYTKYVAPKFPKGLTTESVAQSTSWGVLQVMGLSIRELGYSAIGLATLCEPSINFRYGCMLFATKLKKAKGDVTQALLYWNGGSNTSYPQQVLSRQAKYK